MLNDIPEPVTIIGGTGDLGQGFCRYLLEHKVSIVIGSRKEAKAQRIVGELTDESTQSLARGLENSDAAEAGAFVILTIPFWSHEHILPPLRESLEGKPVLDTSVPLGDEDPTRYDEPEEGSAARHVENILGPDVPLTTGFHTLSAHKLEDPPDLPPDEIFYCGDEEAKPAVEALIKRLGFTGHDAGPLEASSTLERLTPLIIHFNRQYGKRDLGFKLVGL